MAMNPLPPQAYTKETLQKAYAWLLTQSPSIKDMASTQDMLISLYLKAQRNGDASLEAPSIQNFKQELKSLAGLMGDLQTPTKQQMMQPPQANPSHAATHYGQPTVQNTMHAQANSIGSQPQYTAPQPISVSATSNMPSASLMSQLDPYSLQALADIKTSLNLGSEVEALRALISLGYKQFKKF